MTSNRSRIAHESILPAILILLLGFALLLHQLEIMALREWFRFWPLLLIGAGVQELIISDCDSRESR